MSLENQLNSGMLLRFREGLGFYGVQSSIRHDVDQQEVERLIAERKLRIESQDKWGVVHLALNRQGGRV